MLSFFVRVRSRPRPQLFGGKTLLLFRSSRFLLLLTTYRGNALH